MQFYDTPKSIKQALSASELNQNRQKENTSSQDNVQDKAFSGPYGNYDVPHAGLAPIPVFRKTCGCVMKLVPQMTSSQCEGAKCNDLGEHLINVLLKT